MAVSHSVKFPELAAEYTAMFASCVIRPDKASLVQQSVGVLRANKSRYASVATHFSSMPWYTFVGVIHGMEGSCSISKRICIMAIR